MTSLATKPTTNQKGFALISALSIMILLVMITVGMLSLSTSEVRRSQQSKYQLEAQANARMAVMIAIAQLQESTGSDLTATTQAGALTAMGYAAQDTHPSQRHYAVAYSTKALTNAWKDDRQNGFLRVLASGDTTEVTDISTLSKDLSGDGKAIKLSPSSVLSDHQTYARIIPIADSQDQRKGSYAWYVSDTGSMASLALSKMSEDAKLHFTPDAFNFKSAVSDNSLDWVPGRSAPENLTKLHSTKTVEVLQPGGMDQHQHWVTNCHKSLLTNPLTGKFKNDLSAALDSKVSSTKMEEVLGERMFPNSSGSLSSGGYEDPGGPKWLQARSFYELANNEKETLPIRPQTEDQMGIFPVIAGFTEYYGICNSRGYAPAAYPPKFSSPNWFTVRHVMTMNMSPVIKLWNPYNRPLETSDYTFAVRNSDQQYDNPRAKNNDASAVTWVEYLADLRLPIGMRFEHRYHIPPVRFEPGEVKVFSLDKNTYLDAYKGGSYSPGPSGHSSVGHQVDLKAQGYILGTLTEQPFSGHSFWDLHFTTPETQEYDGENLSNFYVTGRGMPRNPPYNVDPDGSRTQINDTSNGTRPFEMYPGNMKNWSIEMYKGKILKSSSNSAEKPLVSIKNINTAPYNPSGGNTSKRDASLNNHTYHTNAPYFTDGNLDSIWTRSVSLRLTNNDAEQDTTFLNPEGHPTKKVKWLADFNPRAATIGCSPYEYAQDSDPTGRYVGTKPTVTPAPSGSGNGLGTPGNYQSGISLNLTSIDAVEAQPFIGYSDNTGVENCILFEVPSSTDRSSHFLNVGQLRHANFSIANAAYNRDYSTEDFFADNMQPAYLIGESNADIRIPINSDTQNGTTMKVSIKDGAPSAFTSTHYDAAWHMNKLWDSAFFSAADTTANAARPSHNPRYTLTSPTHTIELDEDGITENAAKLYVNGTLNVNGASAEAWAALLSSTMGAEVDGTTTDEQTPFARLTSQSGELANSESDPIDESNYNGFRALTEDEIRTLSEKIVEQVQLRGPFFSLSDFVNRAASENAPSQFTSVGALQAAINAAGLNDHLGGKIEAESAGGIYNADAFAGDIALGVPGSITQGDILARLGHLLTTRSDTFTIRAYGDSIDSRGKVLARAWCEAEVQRVPDYVDSSDKHTVGYDALTSERNKTFGRSYRITSFRWISAEEMH